MKHNTDLDGFQKIIQYQFNNIGLLKNALTHSSYANEKKTGNYKDNERLEFLGDAVLELTSSEFIYTGNPDMNEGKMTRLRASIVCEPTLAMCARQIHLQEYIMLGKGEDLTGGRTRDSIILEKARIRLAAERENLFCQMHLRQLSELFIWMVVLLMQKNLFTVLC